MAWRSIAGGGALIVAELALFVPGSPAPFYPRLVLLVLAFGAVGFVERRAGSGAGRTMLVAAPALVLIGGLGLLAALRAGDLAITAGLLSACAIANVLAGRAGSRLQRARGLREAGV